MVSRVAGHLRRSDPPPLSSYHSPHIPTHGLVAMQPHTHNKLSTLSLGHLAPKGLHGASHPPYIVITMFLRKVQSYYLSPNSVTRANLFV